MGSWPSWSRHPQMPDEKFEDFLFIAFGPEIFQGTGTGKGTTFFPLHLCLSFCQSICSPRLSGGRVGRRGLSLSFLALPLLILPPATSVPLSVSDSLLKKSQPAINFIGSWCLTLTLCGLEGFQPWFYQN